jgi:hypothetical protein
MTGRFPGHTRGNEGNPSRAHAPDGSQGFPGKGKGIAPGPTGPARLPRSPEGDARGRHDGDRPRVGNSRGGRFRESPRAPNWGWKRAPGWDPPPMRAEARSRRPVSPIPGLPGKEGAGEVDMRGEGSWSGEGVPGKAMLGAESVALSFAPRLLPPPACPSLPRPLSLLSALARSARPIPSPCPSRSSPSSFPFLCFHGSASLSPGLLFAGPGSHAAIPGENLVRPGFSAWRNPASL